MSGKGVIATALAVSVLLGGCAHEVEFLSEEPPELDSPASPFPMTVAVGVRSFEATRLKERGVIEHLAGRLRDKKLFQAVMYPIPQGANPTWELQLLARDQSTEPNSNFWKGFIAQAILPAAFFIWLQSDYTLDLEILMLRRGQVVGSYQTTGRIRFHYQSSANTLQAEAQGVSRLLDATAQTVLAQLSADLSRIQSEYPF